MKNRILQTVILFFITLFMCACAGKNRSVSSADLVKGFINTPDSIQTGVYWYWMSDNISKEGVIKDLEAMKKAGINRAFIGNVWQDNVPAGKVKMFSDEWWDVLHTALKTATKLNIEIGLFNSPGWSQSGGPWVKPEEAMRYLNSSEEIIKGPLKLKKKLKKPADLFQDVRVIAYPDPEGEGMDLNNKNAKITSSLWTKDLSKLTDGDLETGFSFPSNGDFTIDFKVLKPFTARSLSVWSAKSPINNQAVLQIKEDNGEFRTISVFQIDRYNSGLNVGFKPYAPVVVSFPATTSKWFRLIFKGVNSGCGLREVSLSAVPKVERYPEKTLAKMFQTPHPMWKDYMWRKQPELKNKSTIIDASKVIDLTKNMSSDGTLRWNVPAGKWVILRTGMTPTGTTNAPASPEATGYEIDKMSKEHVATHFNAFLGKVLERIPESDRKTFKIVVEDSYETGGQNFTDNFLNLFKQRYGYDPVPYLPVYEGAVVNSEKSSDRFLWDMRRLVADKVAYDYVGGLRDVSHKHGLTTWLECYGHWGFPGEFLMYGGQSDEVAGEFWSEGSLGDIENRAASSCGHIYGKRKISAESNTCGGPAFSRYPAKFKQRGDRFFAEGINNTLLHVYIEQPYEDKNPGVNASFGNEFNRKNTWFSQLDVYTAYLKRVNFMLQQGLNVADAAYFIGEDTPKMTGVTDPVLPVGYQFDYMNAEVIEKYMTVENGLLILPHGTQYRILVLPKQETMRPELLAKIKQLVEDGAVVLGPAPKYSPSLQNQPVADQKVKKMAADLWGDVDGIKVKSRKFGKGMIMEGMTMKEAFAEINCVPDCKLPENNNIHFGHRTMKNAEIYFVSNQTNKKQIITPEFRISKKQPELWDATTGDMRILPVYEQKEKTTAVPMELASYESAFVVFRKHAGPAVLKGLETNYPKGKEIVQLEGPWKVQFDSAQRGPKEPIILDTLIDWCTSSDEQIKYYSGTADYNIDFKLDISTKKEQIMLNLGSVKVMAKIWVNGKYAGGVWTPPYRLNITKMIKNGNNKLKISVVNTWVNRLIGDQNLPESQRKTWCPVNPYNANSSLQSSGLIGPVTISGIN
ncbi:MAG: hypothetical protein JJE45_02175 [Prolixibacteraceae bacterium]|nr:hypothetical protein [Prolixibacteraceae bacterium]